MTDSELRQSLVINFDTLHESISNIKEACEGLGVSEELVDAFEMLDINCLKAIRKIRLTCAVPYFRGK